MRLLLEIFLFLGIFFPLFHILNVLLSIKRGKKNIKKNIIRPVTILIPCYNEEKIIKNTIEGLLRIEYDNFECIFINDGSSDNTLKEFKSILKLKETKRKRRHNLDSYNMKCIYRSELYPNMYLIDKNNGGKSDALNLGINYSKNKYIVTLDADSILKPDALSLVSKTFDDKNVVAASGVIQILQSFNLSQKKAKTTFKIKLLLRLQAIEYIKSCFCYKASLAKLESLLVISGAFGIFRKDILLDVGGFSHTIGEDLDLTLKIQFHIQDTNKKIVYVPEAICYTEGPETFKDLIKQRKRWQKSFIEALINFRKRLFKDTLTKPLPFFMIVDALVIGVLSSFIIVVFTILVIDNIMNNTLSNIALYFYIFISVHLTYNVVGLFIAYFYNVRYKGLDNIRIVTTIILDLVVYRIIILYTIIVGTISYFTEKNEWNKVDRSGHNYNVLKKD
ncbi:MAG: glycosyltransferase family 2 protein [Bacilli bacterium]|nr:glycosyltransferase family 2 protein [Bacilli bacterium]MDD3304561.1 glycosyltransferase family 2 protein [Bacilli bacterium]MDD4053823.1 glycosyltransferase family 2 protein [Bacilli bacterium]MDD4411310.1 glycosyltransferase family 2 protein [Bacilli bacterium]